MKTKASEVDSFKDLHATFDPKHEDTDELEIITECGCLWWECIHCIHGILKISCMQCDDPFKTL